MMDVGLKVGSSDWNWKCRFEEGVVASGILSLRYSRNVKQAVWSCLFEVQRSGPDYKNT